MKYLSIAIWSVCVCASSVGVASQNDSAHGSDQTKKPVRLGNAGDVWKLRSKFHAAYLVLGHGSKGMFKSMPTVKAALEPVAKGLNRKHGTGAWLVVFGGDPFAADKPDVAHVVKYFQQHHGTPVLAIQSDIVDKEWGGVDKHLDYVRYVATDYHQPTPESKPAILWGGFRDGQPVGATKGYLSDTAVRRLLSGVIAVGGGPIALEEAKYAHSKGKPVIYVPAETRHPEVNGVMGSVHEWAIRQLGADSFGTVPE